LAHGYILAKQDTTTQILKQNSNNHDENTVHPL